MPKLTPLVRAALNKKFSKLKKYKSITYHAFPTEMTIDKFEERFRSFLLRLEEKNGMTGSN